jgi:opacity protein-like surface antigen
MKKFMMAAASAAMIASPVLAQQASNGQQTREQARKNSQGPANANQRGVERSNENSVLNGGQSDGGGDQQMRRRGNSQGSANASDRGRERANQNSAVSEGMMVHDKNNKMIGRVKEVKRAPDGTVIAIVIVLVVAINGTTQITLTPGQFQIVAGVIIAIGIVAPTGS